MHVFLCYVVNLIPTKIIPYRKSLVISYYHNLFNFLQDTEV